MISQTLSQKLLQKMSPQQIQLMKLLQVPTFELEQRIKEEIESNPALEEGNESNDSDDYSEDDYNSNDDNGFDFEDYFPEYSEEDYGYRSAADGYQQEEKTTIQIRSGDYSLRDYLENQLELSGITDETDNKIALQIIGSIDEDGYLRREPIAITDDLLFSQNLDIPEHRVLDILKIIQTFDPKGVGARNLQEALVIQIRAKLTDPDLDPLRKRDLQLAEVILCDYFTEFSKKHFSKLASHLNISDDELKDVYDEILKLNPKPSGNFDSAETAISQYVEPDFIVFNRDGKLEMQVNSRNAPDLKISNSYIDLIRNLKNKKRIKKLSKDEKDTALFVKQKIEAAQLFIESIRKRYNTLYNTMYAIMAKQYNYFISGDTKDLKPMILKDIAEEIDVDISTVSRVANSKFVQTEFGTKKLKEFFSDKIQSNDGEDVSTIEVRNTLADLINEEDKSSPFSDEQLMELLSGKGYTLSRRTIAKYREKMNIPVARLRKEM